MSLPALKTKIFSSRQGPEYPEPNLIEIQTLSYEWFLKEGLKELFDEISPIKDYTSKELELHFLDYSFDSPKYTEGQAKEKDQTYEASLRIKVKLIDKVRKRTKVQDNVYLGDFPVMTERGTFIINGVERVVISQLIRSAGIYFTAEVIHGKRYFGAKVIPSRGSWLEFETSQDGFIGVKIDRKRKAPVSELLRIFGLTEDQKILETFAKEDKGEIQYLQATLKKDKVHTIEESYIDLYERLRPGELATVKNAQALIDPMFSRFDRYDLGRVGRFKLNQRLGLDKKKDSRFIDLEDLIAIIKEIIRLNNNPQAEPDNIDHLGNRRVRAVGELAQLRLRVGFARLKRVVQDRMSTLPEEDLQPVKLLNYKVLIAVLRDFFASSQLSQFMDQVNPLAELEHKRRLSTMGPGGLTRERAGLEVRDVLPSYYGRICPIQTPEGANIGLVNSLATYARLNEFGFLETPYFKVKNGAVTSEAVWLDAVEEERYTIASGGIALNAKNQIIEKTVEARIKGKPGLCNREEIDFIDVSPNQLISVSTSLIPFLEHDDANRALMGSNMQRQAVPLVRPEAPLVSTGQEEKAAFYSGQLLISNVSGVVSEVDAQKIVIKTESGSETYPLVKFKRPNQPTCLSQRPIVKKGQKVKKGEILADGSATNQGVLSLGQNLLAAFIPWEGANFEDAVILSERVARGDCFTSVHIETFLCLVRETKLGSEITTPDIANVSEEKLRNLDEEGIIRIGAEVQPNDILVGKISPKGELELTSEERLLKAIFGEKAREVKDTSLTLPNGKRGRVIGIKIFDRDKGDKLEPGIIKKIQVEVAQIRKIRAGDKLSGRHGNKGVISQIRPVEDMPYLEDGTPVDIVLNPLGVISRMNLGQIFETHLGWAAHQLGYRAIVPNFVGATEEEIKGELIKAGLPASGKITVYNGLTGESFRQPIAVGYIYMMKLNHLVEDKIHMRSTGPYSLITQQPLGGKAQMGGQRFGEMEVWALEGYGAAHLLQEMSTIKSDDVIGRSAAFEAIIRNQDIKKPNIPASFKVLVSELKSLGLSIFTNENKEKTEEEKYERKNIGRDELNLKSISIKVASPEEIKSWSYGEVTKAETINYRTQRPEKNGLFSERIFGPTKDYECYCGKYKKVRYKGIICEKCGVEVTRSAVRRERMGHITLAAPIAHIWFLRTVPSRLRLLLDVSLPKLEKVVYFAAYIVTSVDEGSRKKILKELEKEFKSLKKKAEADIENLTAQQTKLKEILTILKPGLILNEDEYLNLAERFGDIFEADRGAGALRKILEKIDLNSLAKNLEKEILQVKDINRQIHLRRRLKLVKSFIKAGIRPEWTILTILPVLPPELRPMVALDGGRYATADLNDLYRRVINRNNRLKKLIELKSPEVIIANEKRMLQEAVDALIDNTARTGSQILSSRRRPLRSLADTLKGKQGRFRQNLLGKRVDYSGRSVIVIGPELKLNECGLPKILALELFRPFVISKIIERGLAYNIKNANRFIEQESPEVWAILEEVIADKRVLLNRAPTLHRLSIQAFKPILIEGLAIRIPPMVCAAFNADFDGDQMAVHLPLTKEAQYEAKHLMDATLGVLKPANGEPITSPTTDITLGCYFLTKIKERAKGEGKIFADEREAMLAYENGFIDIQTKIKVPNPKNSNSDSISLIETTYGRLIFNRALPAELSFVNETMNKKALSRVVSRIIELCGPESAYVFLDKIKDLGFSYSTLSAITWNMSDVLTPPAKKEILARAEKEMEEINSQLEEGLLTQEERTEKAVLLWTKVNEEVSKEVSKILLPDNPIFSIIDSGSRGSWSQINQMMGMKGLVQDPNMRIIELPIKSSYKEGLGVLEYFFATHGARKGSTDTALKTAQAGYLTRRLVDVAQDLIIKEKDCGTNKGIEIVRKESDEYNYNFAERLFSRTALEDIRIGRKLIVRAGEIISQEQAKKIQESGLESVKIRSPITCKSFFGVCSACYGLDLSRNKPIDIGEAIGIIAAQSIGEPGMQLTLRTFHVGGIAGMDITYGLPRVEEVFEARPPKGAALLAKGDGKVKVIEEKGNEKIIKIQEAVKSKSKKSEIVEYPVPIYVNLLIKEGERVYKGQPLYEGPLNLRDVLIYQGIEALERYIINEVQKIYVSAGASINDKHIEVIVRQMLSRVLVTDPGDTEIMVNDLMEKSRFLQINKEMKQLKGNLAKAKQKILGISRVALTTESFLSAASFQETSRVLVTAATEGRTDYLRGLKENVIIGKLIPVGTAFRGIPKDLLTPSKEADKVEEKEEDE